MLRRRRERSADPGREDVATSTDVGAAIVLDYPVRPRPRFGHGQPRHSAIDAILAARRDTYRSHLDRILEQRENLLKIPVTDPASPQDPHWFNGWLPGLDGAALYTFVAAERPSVYIEVGSGNSTKFARRAVRDHGLPTQIVSIDPHPRAEIDALCDRVIRSPLEDTSLDVFDQLEAGDIVFVDNSHRVFTNSDATVVFLELLPRLRPGVLVQVHDIFLPEDYPAAWNDRYYSEQYLLAAYLLGGNRAFHLELPCWYVANDEELAASLAPLWNEPALEGAERHGNSFWVRMRDDTVAAG